VVGGLKEVLGIFGERVGGMAESGNGDANEKTTTAVTSTATGVRMMNGMLARRASGSKKRRRYDSGLGFLEEEDELDGVEE